MSLAEVACARAMRRLIYGDHYHTNGGYEFVVLRLGNFTSQRIYPAAWYGVSTLGGILAYARQHSKFRYLTHTFIDMDIYSVWAEQPTGNDIFIAAYRHGEEVSL